MQTHKHMVLYILWCWHISKGEVDRVVVDELEEEMEARRCHRV